LRPFTFDRLDRYALRLFAAPLALALVALLLAQLLERLLRLFDLAAQAGAGPASVFVMAANLVPHYLGLALPMAFTAAMFIASARMGDDNELDVLLATGRSISRIAWPYFMLALLLSVFNLYLVAQLQPLTRYGYHVAVYQVRQTGWDARVEAHRFIDIGDGYTFSVDALDADGRGLHGVFIERRRGGVEEITTAARGRLVASADGRHTTLRLEDGQTLSESDAGDGGGPTVSVSRFAEGLAEREFTPVATPFPERGAAVRERTLGELWSEIREDPNRHEEAAEFHGRLARALVLPLLPLVAVPLGMASKRGRRAPGVVFATVALLALDHALQFAQSLAETGRVPAAPAIWGPYLAFALLGAWIFRSSLAWPGDNPVSRAVLSIERLFERGGGWRRLWRGPT
jgi:lipopolysaccharide export system permease protein